MNFVNLYPYEIQAILHNQVQHVWHIAYEVTSNLRKVK